LAQRRSRPPAARRGGLTTAADRAKALEILEVAVAAGARAAAVARLLGVGLTMLQRWRRQFASDGDGVDRRKGSHRHVAHRLSAEERQRILLTCNEPRIRGAAARTDRDGVGRSGPPYRFRAQLLPSAPRPWTGSPARTGKATTGPTSSTEAACIRSESSVELGYHLSPHHRARDLAVPLSGHRRLEPQGGDLGRC